MAHRLSFFLPRTLSLWEERVVAELILLAEHGPASYHAAFSYLDEHLIEAAKALARLPKEWRLELCFEVLRVPEDH